MKSASLFVVAVLLLGKQDRPVAIEIDEVRDHRVGSPVLIHSTDSALTGFEEYITEQVTVDALGRVDSVKSVTGRKEFFGEAEKAEAKQAFKPFQRNGSAVSASFRDYVSIVPPEQWSERQPFPNIKNWNSLKMRLERTMCYGRCPAYSVEVSGNGEVNFVGERNVLNTAHYQGKISRQAVESLLAVFRQANYFSLQGVYAYPVTDSPTYSTSIEFDGVKESVRDYVGLQVGMPEAVRDLENAIDRIAGTEKWIKGNGKSGTAPFAEK